MMGAGFAARPSTFYFLSFFGFFVSFFRALLPLAMENLLRIMVTRQSAS
jgi:hypothetical protein